MESSLKGSIYQNKDYLAICYSFRKKVTFLTDTEFRSYVLESIWRADSNFDKEKGVRFETYLYTITRNIFYKLMREQYQNEKKRKVEYKYIFLNDSNDLTVDDKYIDVEIKDTLMKLPKENRDFLYSRFFLKHTDKEFCEKYGITKGELATLKKKSYKLFRRYHVSA